MMTVELLKANREERGLALARTAKIKNEGGLWIVPSQSMDAGSYVVRTLPDGTQCCTCPDWETRQLDCKHIFAVRYVRKEIAPPDDVQATEIMRPTYSQHPAYRKARMNEKVVFQRLLRALCDGIEQPPYKGNGRPALPLADVIFFAGMKVYGNMSGDRANGDVLIAQERGLTGVVPHPNTVFRILRKDETIPILRRLIEESAKPLREVEVDFAADATGIAASQYVKWFDKKWGKDRREKMWLKLHCMCGVKTLVVTGVEVTSAIEGDSPQFASLVEQTARTFTMREVSIDKGYLARKNMHAVVNHGAEPFVPFKPNSVPGRDPLWNKLLAYYVLNREDFLRHYHKRSNVEALFSSMKRVLGPSVRAKKAAGPTSEILLKVLCHNIRMLVQSMFELKIDPTFWDGPKEAA